jgi:hypothetical protein
VVLYEKEEKSQSVRLGVEAVAQPTERVTAVNIKNCRADVSGR